MGSRHAKITTKLVTGLKHETSQYDVTDTELPGFRVCVALNPFRWSSGHGTGNGGDTLSVAMAS